VNHGKGQCIAFGGAKADRLVSEELLLYVLRHVILLPDASRAMLPSCLFALHSRYHPREAV
jgi:hypothetical protein